MASINVTFEYAGLSHANLMQRLFVALTSFAIPLLFFLGLSINKSMILEQRRGVRTEVVLIKKISKNVNQQTQVRTKNLAFISRASSARKLASKELQVPKVANAEDSDSALHDTVEPFNNTLTMQEVRRKAAFEAYQNARSELQKLAERRGVNLVRQVPTKYDEFQLAADRAVIPNCLEKGASTKLGLDSLKGLLVVPALALSAIRGKCQ